MSRNADNNTVAIATKINRHSKILLDAIAKKHGLKIYNLLQVVINAYLRSLAPGQLVTNETTQVINTFANFNVSKDAFLMCRPDKHHSPRTVNACIAFVGQKSKSTVQPMLIYTKKDKNGNTAIYESMADDTILKTYLRSVDPEAIKKLWEIKEENNLLSLTDALKFAIHEKATPEQYDMAADIEEMFADNNRAEDGTPISFEDCAGKYVRHNSRYLSCMR